MNDGKKYLISLGLNERDLREIENRMTNTLSTAMENGMSLDRSGKAMVKKDMEVLLGYVKELTSSISSATPDVATKLVGNLKNVLPMISGLADKMKQVNASTDWMKQGFTFGDDIYTTIKALDTVQKDIADVRKEVSELTTSLNPFMNALKANDPSAFFKKFGDGFQSVSDDATTMRATITKEIKAIESSGNELKNLMKDIRASSRKFVDVKSAEDALKIFTSLQSKIESYEDFAGAFGKGIAIEYDIEEVKDYAKALVELQNLSKNKFAANLFDVKGGTVFTEDIKVELQEITQSIAETIKQAGADLQKTVDGLNLKEVKLSITLPDADAKKIEQQANDWIDKFNEKFKAKPIKLAVDMADPFKTYKPKAGKLTDKQKQLAEDAKKLALESLRKISGDENLEANFSGLDDPETSRILRKLAESFDKIRKGVELGQKSILDATKEWRAEIEKLLTLSFKWEKVDVGSGADQLLNDLQRVMDDHLMQINVDKVDFVTQIEQALKDAKFNINGNFTGSGSSQIVFTGTPIVQNPPEQNTPPKTPPTPQTPPKSSDTPKSEDVAQRAAEIVAKPANALTRAVEELDAEIKSLQEKKRLGQEAVEQRKVAKAKAESDIANFNAEKATTTDEARKIVLDLLIAAAKAAKDEDIQEYNGQSKDEKIAIAESRKNAIKKVLDQQEDPSKLVVDVVNKFYQNNDRQADRRLREIALIDKDLSAKYAEVINLEKEISKLNPATDGNKISELRGKIEKIKPEIDMLFGGVTESVVAEYVSLEKQIEKAKQKYAQTNSNEDKLYLDGLEKRQQEIQSGLSYLRDDKGVSKAFFEKFEEATNIEREIAALNPIKDKSKISELRIQLKKIVAEMGNIFQGLKEKTAKELADVETQLEEARKKYTLSQSAQDKKVVDQLEDKRERLNKGQNAVQYLENNRVKKQLFEQTGFRNYDGLDINTAIQFVNDILKGSTTLTDTLKNLNANGVKLDGNILDNLVYFIPRVQEMMGIVAQSSQQWEQTEELKQRFLRIADLAQQISGLFNIRGSNATVESLQEFINVFGKIPTLHPVVEAAKNHLNSLLELSNYVGDDKLYQTIIDGNDVDSKLFKLMQSSFSELPNGVKKELKNAIPSLNFSKLEDKDVSKNLQQAITNQLTTAFKSGGLDSQVFEQLKSGVPALQKFYDVLKLIVLYSNKLKTDDDLYKLTGSPRTGYIKKLQGQIEKGDSMVATVGSGTNQRTYGLQNKYNNEHHPIPGVNNKLSYDSSSFLSTLGLDKLEYEKFILSQSLFAEKDKLENEIREIIAKEDAAVAEAMVQSRKARINAIDAMIEKSGTKATSETEAKARIKEIEEQMFANMSLSSPRDIDKQEYLYDQTTYAKKTVERARKVAAQANATPEIYARLQKEIEAIDAVLTNREVILEAVRALMHDKDLAKLDAGVAEDAAQKWKGYRSTKYHHKTNFSNIFNKTVGEYTDENGNVWDMSEARQRFSTALQYGTMNQDAINPLLPLLNQYEDALAELRDMPEDTMLTTNQIEHKDNLKKQLDLLKSTILNIYYETEGWLVNDLLTREIQSVDTKFKAAQQGVLSDTSSVESHYKGLENAEESRYATQKSQIESKYADKIDMSGGMSDIASKYEQERRQIISDKYNQAINAFKKQQEEEYAAFENEIKQKIRDPYAKYKEAKAAYDKEKTKENEAIYKEADKKYTEVRSQGNVELLALKQKQEDVFKKAQTDEWNKATSEVPNELEALKNAARDAANQTVESVANAKKDVLRKSLIKRVESGDISEADAEKELRQGIQDIDKQTQNGVIKRAITNARNKANKALEDFIKGIAEKYGITADLTEKTLAESIVKGDESAKQAELETALTEHNARMAEIEAQRVEAIKAQQEKEAAAMRKNAEDQQKAMEEAASSLQTKNGYWLSDNTIVGQIGRGERAGAIQDRNEANAIAVSMDKQIKSLMVQGQLTEGMVAGTELLGELQQQQTEAMRTNANEIEEQTEVAKQSSDSTSSQQQYYAGGFVGGGIAINTNGLAQETTLRGIFELLNGGAPAGGWGDIQGVVAKTVDELLPTEKAFANSMARVFKSYEGIDYETAGAIGKGGLIGSLKQGNARSVDQKTLNAALAQAVNEEVLALLHNHPNKINALTWQDVDSGLYNANHNKQVKVFGSVGDEAITSLDFTGINDTVGKEIIAKYRDNLDALVKNLTVNDIVNIAAIRNGMDENNNLEFIPEIGNLPAFGWKGSQNENFAWNPIIGRSAAFKDTAEFLINQALQKALGENVDAFKQFNLSDMQGFMQSIVKPAQEQVAQNVVQAGAQAAVDAVKPAPITPNPNPARQKTAAEDVMDALRAGYKADPKFTEIDGEKLLYDAMGKVENYRHSKDQTSDQAMRDMGNAYIKIQEVLNTEIVNRLGKDMRAKIENIGKAAKSLLAKNGVEIKDDLVGQVITPELLSQLQPASKTNKLEVGKIIGHANNPIMTMDGKPLQSAFVTAHAPKNKAEKELVAETLGLEKEITSETEKQADNKAKKGAKQDKVKEEAAAEKAVTTEDEKQLELTEQKEKIEEKTTSDLQAQAQATANQSKIEPAPIESASGVPQGTGGGLPNIANTLSQILNVVTKDETVREIITALTNGVKTSGAGGEQSGDGEKKSLNLSADEALEQIKAYANTNYPGAIKTGNLRANSNSYSIDFWRQSVEAQKEAEKIQEEINKLEAEGKANTEDYNNLIQQRNSLLQKQEKITLNINKDTGKITSKVGIENYAVGANAAEKELQRFQGILSQLHDSGAVGFKEDGSLISQNQSINSWIQSMQALQVTRDKFASEGTLFDSKNQQILSQMTAQTSQLTKEVMGLLNAESKFGGNVVDTFANPQTLVQTGELYNKLLGIATASGKVDMATVKLSADGTTLTYTIEKGKNQVQDMTLHMNSLSGAVTQQAGEIRHVDTAWEKFGKSLKGKWQEVARYLATFGSIYRVWGTLKQGVQYVKEIDTALTELKKVTNETDATYNKFLQTASKTASAVGSTTSEITKSSAQWARLGYSIQEAGELAKSTAVLMAVSEFDDVQTTTEALISSLQAFNYTADDSIKIVDKLNIIGNNFAISSDGIAEGLQRSASTLVAAGNSLEQSIAMLAAGNKVAQDPEALGNALKVLSMRIRGTKTDLEEAGEETDGLITNTSKLRDKVKALTDVNGNGGVDILTDTGAYRSTYDILLDIAEIWDDINDADPKNQAALLEILAGECFASDVWKHALKYTSNCRKPLKLCTTIYLKRICDGVKTEKTQRCHMDKILSDTNNGQSATKLLSRKIWRRLNDHPFWEYIINV